MSEQPATTNEATVIRIREAMENARTAPASDAPWTAEEEHVLAATAANTAKMDIGKVQAYAEAYAPTNLAGRTRMDQLHFEAITRELARRDDLAERALAELEKRVPTFRRGSVGYGLKMHEGMIMDSRGASKLRRMTLEELETELNTVVGLMRGVSDECGKLVPRDMRSRAFEYTHDLRGRIADKRKAARQS